jgi:hypothetical protein
LPLWNVLISGGGGVGGGFPLSVYFFLRFQQCLFRPCQLSFQLGW